MGHKFAREARLTSGDSLVEDIEVAQHIDVTRARSVARQRIKTAIRVQPANVADRGQAIQGSTKDATQQGIDCLLDEPVLVGNVFHIEFDRSSFDVGPQLAVCDRCSMISDAAFDTHFVFVQGIELPDTRDDD